MELLAKSNGTELVGHCRAVAAVSKYLAQQLETDQQTVRLSELAGLLHDIGKADPPFQAYLRSAMTDSVSPMSPKPRRRKRADAAVLVADGNVEDTSVIVVNDDEHDATSGLDVYHNEIGYATMSVRAFDRLIPDLDAGALAVLQQAVLWHHACREDVSQIPPERLRPILAFAAHVLDAAPVPDVGCASAAFAPARMFAGELQDPRDIVVRTCLIAADHIVSALSPEQAYAIADGTAHPTSLPDVQEMLRTVVTGASLPQPATQRDRDQIQCATHEGQRVTQVNAPTGFGKTRVGVLRTMCRKRRTLWVCPRNTVAEAVYTNIVEELEQMRAAGIDPELSVELYLTSRRQKSYGPVDPNSEYTADIIVTNIDMLLKPMVRNGLHERAYLGLFADVVMDEFHEFVMKDSAIFAACHNLLRARTQCGVSSTMCLSATPSVMLAGLDSRDVDYLPAKGKHYPAVHSKPYRVHLHASAGLSGLPDGIPGSLVMLNAVRNAQNHYKRNMLGGVLVHSKYTDADRAGRMESVLSLFGKSGHGRESEQFVVSGPVLQAALNISFRSVHLSSSSAEADLQAARTNRFGEMEQGEIHLYDVKDNGETAAIEARWSRDLQQLWFEFLLRRYGDMAFTTTLDDLYSTYNDFYTEHTDRIRSETDKWRNAGVANLRALAPTRYTQRPASSKASSGPSRPSLRDPDGSCYIIAALDGDSGGWLPIEDAFSVSAQEFSRIVDAEPWLRRESDRKFILSSAGLLHVWKDKNGSNAARIASDPRTPFPTTSRKYSNEFGLVKATGNETPDMDMVA